MNYKHGQCSEGESPTYVSWQAMHQRCSNPKQSRYENYGGRGITIVPEWSDFTVFLRDMGERPDGTTLERKKVEEGYSPGNCCWATRTEQQRNTTKTRWLTYNGETLCLMDWAERLGIKAKTLRARIDDQGWSVEQALATPVPRSPEAAAAKEAAKVAKQERAAIDKQAAIEAADYPSDLAAFLAGAVTKSVSNYDV